MFYQFWIWDVFEGFVGPWRRSVLSYCSFFFGIFSSTETVFSGSSVVVIFLV